MHWLRLGAFKLGTLLQLRSAKICAFGCSEGLALAAGRICWARSLHMQNCWFGALGVKASKVQVTVPRGLRAVFAVLALLVLHMVELPAFAQMPYIVGLDLCHTKLWCGPL